VEYEYDANGNLTQITIAGSVVWTYTYNAANRLVHVEDGTGTINANYYDDPFGRRLWKDVGGVRTYFFYSEEGLIAEYDASGTEIRSYGYKPDSTWTTDPLWLKEGGSYYWYQNDHLGTPQKLTAQDGTVVWSAQYTAFGEAVIDLATVENNLRFPGQFYDDETGLHYNFNRYFNPKIGRYLRVDPIGFLGGDTNLYEYTKDNPVNRFDALGLFWWVSRKKDNAKALAVCCNDTVEELAKKIGLDPYYYTEWLTPLAGERYPVYPTQEIRYQQFYIPNTVYAFWGGQLSGFGRWHTHWNESIAYLQELGFKVIEYHHVFNKTWVKKGMGWFRPLPSNSLNKFYLDDELIDLAKKKELHGLYFWGHGDKDKPNTTAEGLLAGNTTLRLPLFSETEGVLRYDYIQARLPYKMALGLVFACFSNIGKSALSSGTAGSIWEPGYDWYLIPLGVGTYHVGRWIKPGDQETRHFQFQWPPPENMDW
jgi:RHS repeat-associated protein